MERRDFIKGAGIAGAATAAATACAGFTGIAAAEEAAWDYEVDIVVAGFGMGGSIASLRAAELGAKVLCVEAYTQVGGTSVDSGGGASAPGSLEVAKMYMPYGNDELLTTFVENMPKAKDLLADLEAHVRINASGFTLGDETNHAARLVCFEDLAQKFQDMGGTLLLETKMIKLLVDADGAIEGALARDKDGNILRIKAKAVILCCGGFQNNPRLKTMFFGPYGDQAVCRAVPTNDGTGMLMAQEIGAGLSKSLGSFYGHSVASNYDIQFMEFNYIASQYHDNRSIVVNLDGKRFADEGMGLAGDLNNEALVRQRWGRGCVVFDQYIYDKWGATTAGGTATGVDRTQEVIKRGGRVVSADTIEELAQKMSAWGYNAKNVVKTVAEYNAAIDNDATDELDVPRTAGQIASIVKIEQPPFWATEVVGGISCCFGGLAINPKTEVLTEESKQPIPGLYAAPGTAGGITFVNYYMSSIGAAAAYGYATADNACAYAGIA